jgi:hypothetical protein
MDRQGQKFLILIFFHLAGGRAARKRDNDFGIVGSETFPECGGRFPGTCVPTQQKHHTAAKFAKNSVGLQNFGMSHRRRENGE